MEGAMELSVEAMHDRLVSVLGSIFTDFEALENVERLSGGASKKPIALNLPVGANPQFWQCVGRPVESRARSPQPTLALRWRHY